MLSPYDEDHTLFLFARLGVVGYNMALGLVLCEVLENILGLVLSQRILMLFWCLDLLHLCYCYVRDTIASDRCRNRLKVTSDAIFPCYLLIQRQVVQKFRIRIRQTHRNIAEIILIVKLKLKRQLIELFLGIIRFNNRRFVILNILPSFRIATHTFFPAINQRKNHQPISLLEKRVPFSLR